MLGRIFWKTILLLALAGSIQLVLFLCFSRNQTDSYLAAALDKQILLQKAEKNRVLVAGGSNVAFGLDSHEMETIVGRSTINLGLHAGLGLCYMLKEVSDGARSGDVVILSPEYEHFWGDLAYGQEELLQMLEVNPRAWTRLNCWRQGLELAKRIGTYNLRNSQRFIRSWLQRVVVGTLPEQTVASEAKPLPIYERSAFNDKGDMVRHLGRPPHGSWQTQDGAIYGEINTDVVEKVKQTARHLRSRGIAFYVVFPPTPRSYWKARAGAAARLAVRLGSLAANTPESSVYDDSLFFDTAYHLNQQGRDLRTRELAAIIGRVLQTQP